MDNSWTKSGNQGNQWSTAVIDLSAYANQIVQIRMFTHLEPVLQVIVVLIVSDLRLYLQ